MEINKCSDCGCSKNEDLQYESSSWDKSNNSSLGMNGK
jgi:hypothetical protein